MSSSINYIFLKTSRQICRDHCQQFDFFQVVCRNSGWEIPSLPLDEFCYHRQHSCLPPTQTCSYFVLYLDFHVLPRSITIFDVKNVVRIAPPLKYSWYSDASRHHHSLLGPRVEWTLLSEFIISGNPIASELMDNYSNLVCWLLNRHSDVGRATQPLFWMHLSNHV